MDRKLWVIGVGVGVAVLGLAIAAIIFICCKRRKNAGSQESQTGIVNKAESEDVEAGTTQGYEKTGRPLMNPNTVVEKVKNREGETSTTPGYQNLDERQTNSKQTASERSNTHIPKKDGGERKARKSSPENGHIEDDYEEIDDPKGAYENLSFIHGAIPLSEIKQHCNSHNILRQFQGLEMQVKKLHPGYAAEMADSDPIYAVSHSTKDDKTAIFVDAFQRPNHFIVASQPTKEFWNMIFERGVKTIVQLDSMGTTFYPQRDGDSYYMSKYELTRVKTEKSQLMSIIRLSVEGDDLYVLVINCWADSNKVQGYPKVSSMYFYMETLEEYETTGEICILDSDGFSKSGLFITAYNVVSQAKEEQKVDIHQTVYIARSRRPQFVSDVTSYKYLYHLAHFYANDS